MNLLRALFEKKPHKTADGKLALVLEKNGIDLFLDVGANVGQTGLKLRQYGYAKKIISFEPLQSCHDKLCEVAKSDRNWRIFERMALGDRDGETEIYESEASDLSSLAPPTSALHEAFPKARSIHTEKVKIQRLDSLFRDGFDGQRPFLKIDAQGNDFAVLKGAKDVFDKIHGVQVEASLLPLYESEPSYLEILQFLHAAGMTPHIISERTFSRRLSRQLQIDVVFFRAG